MHMCRGATIVFQPLGALVYFCVGSGEYDELTSATASHMLRICRSRVTKLWRESLVCSCKNQSDSGRAVCYSSSTFCLGLHMGF